MAEGRRRLAVVAVGGNALVSDEDHLSIGDQYHNVQALAPALADVLAAGWDLVVTHGNGPQVGFILHRSELASHQVAPVPLDYAVGDTQGAMGYMFAKALDNELSRRGQRRPVVALVTRTVVDGADPACVADPDGSGTAPIACPERVRAEHRAIGALRGRHGELGDEAQVALGNAGVLAQGLGDRQPRGHDDAALLLDEVERGCGLEPFLAHQRRAVG